MDLAAKIKGFRKEKGLTQADLADQVGVARATVINWEKGITRPDGKAVYGIGNDYQGYTFVSRKTSVKLMEKIEEYTLRVGQ